MFRRLPPAVMEEAPDDPSERKEGSLQNITPRPCQTFISVKGQCVRPDF